MGDYYPSRHKIHDILDFGKGGEQDAAEGLSKFLFVGKLLAIGKVETHYVVGSILPELFDGEPPEVAKAVPEERLQSGHEERFAKTSGTYEKHGHERRCELAYQLRFVDIDGAASPEVEIVRLSQRKVGEEDRHTDVFPTDGYESGRTHIVAKGNLPKDFANNAGSVFPDWFHAQQSFSGQKHLRILFAFFELMQKGLKFLSGKTSNAIFFLRCVVQRTKSVDHERSLGFSRVPDKVLQHCFVEFFEFYCKSGHCGHPDGILSNRLYC